MTMEIITLMMDVAPDVRSNVEDEDEAEDEVEASVEMVSLRVESSVMMVLAIATL